MVASRAARAIASIRAATTAPRRFVETCRAGSRIAGFVSSTRSLPPASTCRRPLSHLPLTRRQGAVSVGRRVQPTPRSPPPGGGLPLGVSPYYGWGRVRTAGGGEGPIHVLNLALRRWG